MFGKEIRYVLLFSVFAFIISVILGLLSHVYFFTVLFRAFIQFIFFFIIGVLIGFIYKKYLYDIFKDIRFGSKEENYGHDKRSKKYEKREVDTETLSNGTSIANKSDINDDFKFVEEFGKNNIGLEDSSPISNIELSDKRSDQLSYIEANDPKIVAEAIKTLINKKE
ncbi:hypothetical protein F0310_01315 [Borrelia sp. A-FGy1]|uniref:hypothetical protein n=1 Tax=Borrelia sp. A-FGy1 TaxID=2608247 RepID=UPI0015F4490A|nr:hypothetical protein [Borrelia sp. A-FGy1]QMU99067.1 hypothetical protein F0310_01315 [Borrelia sp. A-FGy1]